MKAGVDSPATRGLYLPASGLQGLVPVANLPATTKQYTFAGLNGAGDITLAGIHAGDVVESVVGYTTSTGVMAVPDGRSSFETVVGQDGKLHQSDAGNLSGTTYEVLVARRT